MPMLLKEKHHRLQKKKSVKIKMKKLSMLTMPQLIRKVLKVLNSKLLLMPSQQSNPRPSKERTYSIYCLNFWKLTKNWIALLQDILTKLSCTWSAQEKDISGNIWRPILGWLTICWSISTWRVFQRLFSSWLLMTVLTSIPILTLNRELIWSRDYIRSSVNLMITKFFWTFRKSLFRSIPLPSDLKALKSSVNSIAMNTLMSWSNPLKNTRNHFLKPL